MNWLECITLNNLSLIKGESLLDTMKSLESQNTSVIRNDERGLILFELILTLEFMINDIQDNATGNLIQCFHHHNLNIISLPLHEPNIMIKDSFLSFDILSLIHI